jgi:hypothetical protein
MTQVPHVSLIVQHYADIAVPTPSGPIYLPQRRICAFAYFGGERVMRQAVVDTGAPASILPWRLWSRLDARGDIAWISSTPPAGGLPRITVFGGSYPFRLGRIRLEIVNVGAGQLAPRDGAVICTDDPQITPPHLQLPLILGLADVMHGRTLTVEASADGQQWTAGLSEP